MDYARSLSPSARSPSEQNYDNTMRKMQAIDEEKARRLQQIASISHAQHTNYAAIEEFNRKRGEKWSDVSQNRQTLQELAEAVRILQKRADDNDIQHTEIMNTQKETEQRLEMHRKALESALQRTGEALDSKVAQNRESIVREIADTHDMFRSREKRINQTMENAVSEEANARTQVANDLAAIEQNVKELRASLADESSKLQANLQSLSAKSTTSFSDVHDLLASDRADRDRALKSIKVDYGNKVQEIKQTIDFRCTELAKDSKAADNQLAAILEALRKDMQETLQRKQELREEDKTTHQDRVLDLQIRFDGMVADAKLSIENASRETLSSVAAVKADLLLETKLRTQDKDRILGELAQECMRRERDEAAIINTLEHLMKQIKAMNTH